MAIVATRGNQIISSAENTTFTNTFGFTAASGRLLVAMAAVKASAIPVMSTPGWTPCMPTPASGRLGLWYRVSNGTETALTVTTSLTTSCICSVRECSGADTVSPLDVGQEQSGVGVTMDVGPTRFTAPDSDGLFAAWFTWTDSAVWVSQTGAGWVGTVDYITTNGSPNVRLAWFEKTFSFSTADGPTMTLDGSVSWQGALVSFKTPLPPNLPAPMQSVR